MDLKTAIEKRSSVREFLDEPVKLDDIREIIRLAGLAPSINNYQPWKYFSISNPDILKKMAEEVTRQISLFPENTSRMAKVLKSQAAWYSTFFVSAPVLIALAGETIESDIEKGLILSHEELDKIRNYPDLQSAGASIQNVLLAATELGYGTCWMTGPLYARESLEKILGIESPWRLISFVAVGKPRHSKRQSRDKRNLADELEIIN